PGRECGPYLDHEPPWREPERRGGILDETERPLVAPKLRVVALHPCRPLCRAHLDLEPERKPGGERRSPIDDRVLPEQDDLSRSPAAGGEVHERDSRVRSSSRARSIFSSPAVGSRRRSSSASAQRAPAACETARA